MAQYNFKNQLGLRIFLIVILTMFFMIPQVMIVNLTEERSFRKYEAQAEVSYKWGEQQKLAGPILHVPYYTGNSQKGKTQFWAHFLPEKLNISGKVTSEQRYRGIYEVVVYNGKINFEGDFNFPDFQALGIDEGSVDYKNIILSFGISDLRGIKDQIKVRWNDSTYLANPGIDCQQVLTSGVSVKPVVDKNSETFRFSLAVDINGSKSLFFLPLGKETNVNITSDWPSPSFTGSFLPDNRDISDAGFNAAWKIFNLNGNYPQQWRGNRYEIDGSEFGFDMILVANNYLKTERTAKYAFLIIALTFTSFFMIELLSKKSIHPVQYLLVGFALMVFYTLLLSISEHLNFGYAYLTASVAIVGMITLYIRKTLTDIKITSMVSGILISLYSYLYVILQLEEFSLLIGSLGLFVLLALIMYLTRNIDWYTAFKKPETDEETNNRNQKK